MLKPILSVTLIILCVVSGPDPAVGLSPLSEPSKSPQEREPHFLPPGNATLETPQQPQRESSYPPLQVYVQSIEVKGSTVFSQQNLEELTAPYTHRYVTTEDLQELRIDVTEHYQSKGFINSGAVIPDQDISKATIQVQIIEGELTQVDVTNNRWFREAFFQKRIQSAASQPLNIHDLQRALQLLQLKDQIKQIRARLKPGLEPGQSILEMEVFEKKPLELEVRFDNHQSPSVGGESASATLSNNNLFGCGDSLSLTYGRSEGLDPEVDAWYALPLTVKDLTATLRYRQNDFSVIEAPFDELDIESESRAFSFSLRRPFFKDIHQELALSLELEYQENETFLLGMPFSFSPGADDGRSQVTALRFGQEWTHRSTREVLALSSRLSLGVDLFGATVHPDRPDGQFLAWLGQAQYARILGETDIQALARLDIQLASDSLLPLEQVAVGGRYSVRGYRENELVRDNGLTASLETRIPIFRDALLADSLFLAPFFDYGRGWNQDRPTPSLKDLYSVGIGLIWTWTPLQSHPEFETYGEIYWGIPLKDVDNPDDDLQDDGLHFMLTVNY